MNLPPMPADDFYHYRIDSNRIFSTGHGYGATFTNALGCYRGDTLRAIAPVAGMPPNSYGRGTVTGVGHAGAWIAHGENDTTVDSTAGGIASRDFRIGQNGRSPTVTPVATTPTGASSTRTTGPICPWSGACTTRATTGRTRATVVTAASASTLDPPSGLLHPLQVGRELPAGWGADRR